MSSADKSFEPAVPSQRPGQPGGKRDRNRRARVDGLIEAALDLFLDKGLMATTIDDIAAGAGVAKGSFYRYFESKRELVEASLYPLSSTAESAFAGCESRLAEADSDEGAIGAYVLFGVEMSALLETSPKVVRFYLQECRGPALGARIPVSALAETISTRSIRLTELAIERRLLRDFPPVVSALAVVGAAERLLLAALHGQDLGGSPRGVPAQLTSLVLQGLLPVDKTVN